MPKIPGVSHLDAVRALEKTGFRIVRQGKHIVMSNGQRIVTIPRHNPVNASPWAVLPETPAFPSSSSVNCCRCTLARILGQKFTEAWGQRVVVGSRPGATGKETGAKLD